MAVRSPGVGLAVAVVVFAVGAAVVLGTMGSAVRTVVLPRGVPARLGSAEFVVVGRCFRLRLGRSPSYERRDAVMAGLAPTALLSLVVVWLTVTQVGYVAMFRALGARPLRADSPPFGAGELRRGPGRPLRAGDGPYAKWSSDRSVTPFRVRVLRRSGPRSAGPSLN